MNSAWSYHNPVRVVAGCGGLDLLKQEGIAGHWLLVTTAGATRRGLTKKIQELLPKVQISVCDGITPNPELDHLDQLTTEYRLRHIDGLIALGGGSVMDAAKVLSVTLPSELEAPLATCLREGKGQAWSKNLAVIAIPTTSGTGAEVTPFATVWDQTENKKYSVTGDLVYPKVAILDPELTLSLPYQETLYTGLDAISHALESIWNVNKTPISESYANQALILALEAFPIVLEDSSNLLAREKMQQVSLLAGLAISQTRTAIAHSISYPLTSHYGVPHGLACSFSLPFLIDFYVNQDHKIQYFDIFKDLRLLLESFSLYGFLSQYASKGELLELVDEMYHPDRLGNYTYKDYMSSEVIKEMLGS